ncbi:MAG: hypothetical protein ACR2G6_17875 [Gemmatimonadaceae bacterium]
MAQQFDLTAEKAGMQFHEPDVALAQSSGGFGGFKRKPQQCIDAGDGAHTAGHLFDVDAGVGKGNWHRLTPGRLIQEVSLTIRYPWRLLAVEQLA